MEQSRRDDLESVGYVLMYFLRGGLPWQGLKIRSKEDRYKKILAKKKETTPEELCKGFPDEFRQFVSYTRNLEYTQQPDYNMLKRMLFELVTKKMEDVFDFIYDWTTESDLKKRKDNDMKNKIRMTNNSTLVLKKNVKIEEGINLDGYYEVVFWILIILTSNLLLIVIGDVIFEDKSKCCKYKTTELDLTTIFPSSDIPWAK